jgi:hypothetical protein
LRVAGQSCGAIKGHSFSKRINEFLFGKFFENISAVMTMQFESLYDVALLDVFYVRKYDSEQFLLGGRKTVVFQNSYEWGEGSGINHTSPPSRKRKSPPVAETAKEYRKGTLQG